MTDPEIALEAKQLQVDSVNIRLSVKVTRKYGDDFQSVESSTGLTLRHPEGKPISPGAARLAMYQQMPMIDEKVYADLFLHGAIEREDAKVMLKKLRQAYRLLAGEPDDTGSTPANISTAATDDGEPGHTGGAGPDISAGQAPGMPDVPG